MVGEHLKGLTDDWDESDSTSQKQGKVFEMLSFN